MINDSNTVIIRLKQIQENGKVTITKNDIFVFYQFSIDQSFFAEEINKYKRIITYDELYSLDLAIELLSNENSKDNELYSEYRKCFKQACELQRLIKILHNFGKPFVYQDIPFFNLNKDAEKATYEHIKILIEKYKQISDNQNKIFKYQNQILEQPTYPQFISHDNLLYFGSLLQRNEKSKILRILDKMFHFQEKELIDNFIQDAMKVPYIDDPMKSSIHLFTSIYNKFFPREFSKYLTQKKAGLNHEKYDNYFINLQNELQSYFMRQNFITIKVNLPSETYHVLLLISAFLYNDASHNPFFFENFFCDENSDIFCYFSDFEKREKSWIRIQYSFIIHPEFLSTNNRKILKEKFISRMVAIPDMALQKFVIITSSDEFVFGKPAGDLTKDDEVFTQGETSMKVNSSLMRNYITVGSEFFFYARFYQSKNDEIGKTTFINNEIKRITKNDSKNVKVFNHFIANGNQRIPIEYFNDHSKLNTLHIIHFHFNDDIMKQGSKFWTYLFQLFTQGMVLPENGEPLLIENKHLNFVLFEIPHLNDNEQPIKSFNEFPLPISTKYQMFANENKVLKEIYTNPITMEETLIQNTKFINKENYEDYFKYEMESILPNLKDMQLNIENMEEYINFMYKTIFQVQRAQKISLRKLGYIEKYLHKYTRLYINNNNLNKLDDDQFTIFFYLLTVSSFYAYNYLPEKVIIDKSNSKQFTKGYGLTFIVINDLFNNKITNNEITFYTTKSKESLFKPLKKKIINKKITNFSVCYKYSGNEPLPRLVLQKIFCSSQEYDYIINEHVETNPNSYISRTQMTLPSLFRSSILLSRIFLTQPIILLGDTGCGKTSTLMLLYEYFKLPINKKKHSLDIEVCETLNCHSGVTINDVVFHLKNASKSSKKHVIFFDELNTSPASSYIEHIFLNEKCINNAKFVFIGALNPWRKKNPISSNLTKVGLSQYIKGEEKKISLIEPIKNNDINDDDDNVSDMMYHVNRPQKSTQDIIFNFNPICIKDKYDESEKLYPEEERESIHSIIQKMANGKNLKSIEILKEKIDICINFIRRLMNERAVVSYRDIKRTMVIYNELLKLNYNNKDIPIITVIISFVLTLPNQQEFSKFELDKGSQKCSLIFEEVFQKFDKKYAELKQGGIYKINSRDQLLSLLGNVDELKTIFMNFVYKYTINYLNDNKIWKFKSTFIHLFIMDICIRCKLPCFVIGMPGTSKSYAVELLEKKSEGKLYVSTYMSSRTSSPDGIKSQYYDASFKEIKNKIEKKEDCYCVVFIDEMGNANINPSRPLKFLHGILDHGIALNESGYTNKVATIGVSNYTMDFANMNRGVLVYTGLPEINEIITVFALEEKPTKIQNIKSFNDYIEKLDKKHIEHIFKSLWQNKEPKSIALRSIYNMRYLIDQKEYDVHSICRILRELFNSKRLNDTGEYKDLMSQFPTGINVEEYKNIDNLGCVLERVLCGNTYSNKSLTLLTKNYEVVEYFELFKDKKFIEFLETKFAPVKLDSKRINNFKYQLFSENFKETPEQISQDALKKIIECIKNKDSNIVFIGNHPCFDSILDVLNVPNEVSEQGREVTLGSGFSSKFLLTNTKFYIMLVANFDDCSNISNAFLDRTETVYLDWEMIGKYYLQHKCKIDLENAQIQIREMQEELTKHTKYETQEKENLHSSIEILFNERNNIEFGNVILTQLVKERWKSGIKTVILTKSKILEEIYLPSDLSKESLLVENDTNIQNFEALEEKVHNLRLYKDHGKFIIIKCSNFDKLHFANLKSFFDQISWKYQYHLNVFIVIYGCNQEELDDLSSLSTFRWPILAMEDISIHVELEGKIDVRTGKLKEVKQISNQKINDLIYKLNEMDEDFDDRLCHHFFQNLFNIIIKFTEKDIQSKIGFFNIYDNYKNSNFAKRSDLYRQIKEQFESEQINDKSKIKYFDIQIEKNDRISSTKTLLISKVYQEICAKMQPFFVFRFGVIKSNTYNVGNNKIVDSTTGESNIENFLLKSKYLDIPLTSFVMNFNPNNDPNPTNFLYIEYLEFLVKNEVSFDENILIRKYIADRMISASGYAKNVLNIYKRVKTMISNNDMDAFYGDVEEYNYIFDDDDQQVVYLQTFIDFCNLRSFAAIDVNNFNSTRNFQKYLIDCLSPSNNEENKLPSKKGRKPNNVINLNSIVDRIIKFRNKSILDIFRLPIKNNSKPPIIITNTNPLEIYDSAHIVFKEFNEETSNIENSVRKNFVIQCIDNKSLNDENKDLAVSMMMFYALSKWETDDIKDLLNCFDIKINIDQNSLNLDKSHFEIHKIDLNQKKLKSFGEVWKTEYDDYDFEWNFKGDCLIDEIQSMIDKGSSIKPKFRKWLLYGFKTKEPLSIIGLRRYLNSKTDEHKADLAKILDPFFGNIKIVDSFINYIEDRIKDGHQFPFNDVTDKDCVNEYIEFRTMFKFSKSSNVLFKFRSSKPLIAQYIWFHVVFNDPTKYPLTTFIIEKTPFFIDFQAVPRIIASMIHLRHIFSYNPVYIPIILHCTSLFKKSKCRVHLFDLSYFDTLKNDFTDLQNEVDLLEEYIEKNYKKKYEKILDKSAYYQIEFVLQIYIKKYNKIIEEIKMITKQPKEKDDDIDIIELSSILPNSLITNLTLLNTLLPIILASNENAKFNHYEKELINIFTEKNYQSFISIESTKLPLFKISYEKNEKDFVGFSSRDYEYLFKYHNKIDNKLIFKKLEMENDEQNSFIFHASVLSFFLDIYLNKSDDFGSPFKEDMINNLSNCYLNSYASKIDYSLKINGNDAVLEENKYSSLFTLLYQKNKMYPLQSIYDLLPDELVSDIRKYQTENKDGLKIISSKPSALSNRKSIGKKLLENDEYFSLPISLSSKNSFSNNDIFSNMKLKIIRKIGQCDYYQTYLVENSQMRMKFAANIFYQNFEYYSEELRIKAISVLNSLMKIEHPSIIKYIDFNEFGYDENHYSTLLTEPFDHESLEFYIQNGGMNSKGRVMNFTEKLITIYGIASAMSYLHSLEILHFDLRPANIIEDDDFHPKLINYALKPIIYTIKNLMRIKDFSFYCAPEFYIDNKYTKSSDVYSFSLIAYEIFTNQSLFENATITSHLENIQNGIRPSFNKAMPISLWDLLTSCWSQCPEDRPTFDEILDEIMNIAKNLNLNSIELKEYAELIQDGHNSAGDEPENEPKKSEEKKRNHDNESSSNATNRDEGNSHVHKKGDTKRRRHKKNKNGGDDDDDDEEEEEEEEKNEGGNGNEKEEEEEENEIIKELVKSKINRINLALYIKGDIIGEGGYSIVYEAYLLNSINDEIFAAKASKLNILDREMSDQFVKSFLREVKIHSKLLNSSFIKFIGYSPQNFDLDRTKPTIMMEYAENGTLEEAIEKMRFQKTKNAEEEEESEKDFCLNDTQKLIIIYGISAAMKFLHSLNIIHRDLKPLNILLGKDFLPKVADFGLSILESEIVNDEMKETKGTSAFIAPEIWKNNEYGKPSDVYAFAIIVYELMTGKFLFKNLRGPQIFYQIYIQKFRPSVEKLPQSYQDLINCCWLEDKNSRPTFEQIVEELRTNEGFITKNVDREFYLKCIETIDEDLEKLISH